MIATMQLAEREQTLKPLVKYFEPGSTQVVREGEMVHDYYGVPVWLMKKYLEQLGAAAIGDSLFQKGQCWIEIAQAPRKRIGSLKVGGARVELSGVAGAIQEMLTELEWMTQRW